ncbi:O-antigen ligase family protein, partial [Aliivibrio kagoshimensis]|uniref:O-antigen ligase family protein n=1 Tax=Aliivibrio kagoshimensis TaxID=2910230 RepID=UPI003D0E88C6
FIPIASTLIFFSFVLFEFIIKIIFNKDLTGSGRSEMWLLILDNIEINLLGYGFGGVFWGEGKPAEYTIGRLYYHLGHSHNGFIDSIIDMGLIGLGAYVIIIVIPIIHSISKIYNNKEDYYITAISLSFLAIYSLSGSSFLKQNNIIFIMFCFSIFYPIWSEKVARTNHNL